MDFKPFVGKLRLLSLNRKGDFPKFIIDIQNAKKSHKPVIVVILCCPDYSYKVNNSGWARFTFEDLNFGPGMVSLAYTKAVLDITDELRARGVKGKIIAAYGDNEIRDRERLRALHITESQFKNKVRCNQSSGAIYFQSLLETYEEEDGKPTNYMTIESTGMLKRFYKLKIMKIVKEKLLSIKQEEIEKVVNSRKEIIRDTYHIKYSDNPQFFFNKAKEQILDRLIVGTALSLERQEDKLISILTLTVPTLLKFFNYRNSKYVPVLNLTSSKKNE